MTRIPSGYHWLNPLRWGKLPRIPDKRTVTKEYEAGFWSKLVFAWMGEHMSTGYLRHLDYNDIWLVHPDRAVSKLEDKFKDSFRQRASNNKKHPLLGAIYDTFRREIWLSGICRIVSDIFLVFAPFTLRYLIDFVQEAYEAHANGRPAPAVGKGIGLIVGIMVMQVLESLTNSHFLYHSMMVGGQTRSVLISMIFAKAMRLSNRARAEGIATDTKTEEKKQDGWPDGRIVNLMSNDTQRIFQASKVLHLVWSSPIAILLSVILLIINLTYSALPGVAVLVIGLAGVTRVVRTLNHRRDTINTISDQRTSLTQEILQSIRFVKYFAWERAFHDRLSEIRGREIRSIQILLTIRSALGAVSMAIPIFANMFAYITYALTGHELNAAVIFSSLALFNCLRTPLNWLPVAIGQSIDAWASMKRIEAFLLAEEIEEQAVLDETATAAVRICNASFTWESSGEQKSENDKEKDIGEPGTASQSIFQLQNIDLSAGREELVAVVGAIGSGKTSLLSAIASEMRKTEGDVLLGASRAFCPQHAWIQNATIRDNIIFGKPFKYEWYQQVVEACALYADFRILPAGDMTEIGERGINLSGGQKQRINLARAIYFRSDIILMDDPLSAVDAHVGRHIFDRAICGVLKGKCRILATHQLHVLSRCDRVVWIQDGQIAAQGAYEELLNNNSAFQALITRYAEDNRQDDAGEEGTREETEAKDESPLPENDQGALMTTETKAVRSVPWSVYGAYLRASGTILNAIWILFLLIAFRGSNIFTSLWLSYWSANTFALSRGQYIGVYAGLGVLQGLVLFVFSVTTSVFGTAASRSLLNQAVWQVLRSPVGFFDTTPLGRITRRFTKDIDWMDNNLTDALRMYLVGLSMIIGVFVLTIVYFYYFVIAIVPLALVLVVWTAYYRSSARELKRYESLLDSSMYARFTEALAGISCIRTYGVQTQFKTRLLAAIDDMASAHYLTFGNERWLSVRLDTIGNALVLATGILVIVDRYRMPPSISGLVLSYSLSIVQLIQLTVRQFADVETAMNAAERMVEYTALPTEAPLDLHTVPPTWPGKGEIQFDNVCMRYRPGLPLVLRNFNLHVLGGERIGIVGRTGAGKSSIMTSLFRLVEVHSGRVTIDGVDISTIGLHELRSNLAIIPQDPTLFKGTVRSNLDPFGQYSDLSLWDALRQSSLLSSEGSADEKRSQDKNITLDCAVLEEGRNYSLGQRQLLALARALVRDSKIIVIDEGTSSVDVETDEKVQETISRGFKGKTILSIAHRLRTVLKYDRICVMENGEIVELDTPTALWRAGGVFWGMCHQSGITEADFD